MNDMVFGWDFPKLAVSDTNEHQNVVVVVDWVFTGTDGVNQKKYDGVFSVEFNSDNVFIPFEELTKTQIEAWAIANLPVDTFMADITQSVSEMTTPSVRFVAPPWE